MATLGLDSLDGAVGTSLGLGLYTPSTTACTVGGYWTDPLHTPTLSSVYQGEAHLD